MYTYIYSYSIIYELMSRAFMFNFYMTFTKNTKECEDPPIFDFQDYPKTICLDILSFNSVSLAF